MALRQPHHIHCSTVALPSRGVAGPEFRSFLHGRGRCTSEVRLATIYMGIFCMKARTRVKRRSTERSTGFQSRRNLGVSVICTTVGASKALAASAPSLSAVSRVGLGTCCLKGQDSFQQVLDGLQLGYRVIDTASHYDNESEVAQAVRASQVQREDVFLVTKIWFDDMGEKAPEAILESLRRLDSEYVDLLLMHFPGANDALQSPSANRKRRETTWRAMEEAKSSGRAKSIGVANFTRRHLKEMFEYCREPPSVLQTEIHPYFQQTKLVEFAVQKGLQVQSFSPLAHGELNLLEDKVLKSIAATHQKSTAQVVLRWLLQQNILPIAFSRSRQRLAQNLDTNFQLSSEDMDRISFLDRDMAEARVGFDPNLIA